MNTNLRSESGGERFYKESFEREREIEIGVIWECKQKGQQQLLTAYNYRVGKN